MAPKRKKKKLDGRRIGSLGKKKCQVSFSDDILVMVRETTVQDVGVSTVSRPLAVGMSLARDRQLLIQIRAS